MILKLRLFFPPFIFINKISFQFMSSKGGLLKQFRSCIFFSGGRRWEWYASLVWPVDRSVMAHVWRWAGTGRNPARAAWRNSLTQTSNESQPRGGTAVHNVRVSHLADKPSPWKVISLDPQTWHPPATVVSLHVTFKRLHSPLEHFYHPVGKKYVCMYFCARTVCFYEHLFMCMCVYVCVCVHACVVQPAGRWSGWYSELKQYWKRGPASFSLA